MITHPTAPSPGNPVSAGFFARLIAWVKSGQLVEGPGYRLRRSPNGTALDLQQSKQAKTTVVPRCFDIRRASGDDTGGFDNPYFQVGCRLYRSTSAETCGFSFEYCIIALKINATFAAPDATVVIYESFADLQTAQDNSQFAIIPLYEVGEKGVVLVDFRDVPTFGTWEPSA